MIRIYQTKFGGIDKPVEEQGNCFQACLASVLEIPLEDAFDCIPYDTSIKGSTFEAQSWYIAFNKWLAEYGLASIYLKWTLPDLEVTPLLGYHLAEVKSSTLKYGETHCVIIHNGDLVHDPNPKSKVNKDDLIGIYLLVPLDVAFYIAKVV